MRQAAFRGFWVVFCSLALLSIGCSSGGGPGRCTLNADCPAGQACDNGVCHVVCNSGLPCDEGECIGGYCLIACSGDGDCGDNEMCQGGYCVVRPAGTDGGPDGSGTDGGDGGGGGDIPICDEMSIGATAIPPNLLLVVDKSGSMDDRTSSGSNRTKMQDLKEAVHFLLDNMGSQIRFGFMSFPNCGFNCDTDYCEPGVVSVQVSDTSAVAIGTRIDALSSNGGTPTGGSLLAADTYFTNLADTTHRHFVVLITDGMPTCPNGNGRQNTTADNTLALQGVQTLRSHGVDTFVIGLGEDLTNTNPELLNQMAEAGGWPRAGADKYYKANSLSDLQTVLGEIGGMIIGCNLALGTIPEYPNYLWVYFDGVAIARDRTHVNGWDYDPTRNAIDFYGAACDQLRSGSVTKLDVKMGCAPPD